MTNPNKERTKNEFGMDNWLRKTDGKKEEEQVQPGQTSWGIRVVPNKGERDREKNHPLSRQFNESTKRPSTRNRHGECVCVSVRVCV
jgi:hypothetical protein